ncbi:uncharacterized protein LOC130725366 [Lotus japonicus]|uniref:uncharacterized protein LOC130725366 n=1 Tax=Lotus japonicus TaxID=34305 RepID=UPI0025841448|nr:uncharacterized protein LOC130725366 [Lotus japonicus]
MKSTGFDGSFVVEAVGFYGGIWLLWNKQWGSIDIISSHRQLVHTRITPRGAGSSMLATFVYGSPNVSARYLLWRELRHIAASIFEPWAVVGDFNSYLHASDKVGGGPPNLLSMNKFRDCIVDCSLSDIGFKGPPFTWEGRGVKERIDWALGNDRWVTSFPTSSVLHLPNLKSDHKPLLIRFREDPSDVSQRPFRFLASWLTHAGFPKLVEDASSDHGKWPPSSAAFREAATSWNSEVFGEIGRRKRKLMRRLEGINNKLHMLSIPYLEKLQKRLWEEYYKVLMQEELLWKQNLG